MPFSQEGFRKIPLLYQDYVIRYLHEWIDPSLRLAADYTPLSTQQQIHAQQLIAQSLPQSTRANVLSDAFIQCHNVINSCRFQGRTMTAVECCRSVRTNVPTVNGICWSFKDKTLTVNNTALNNDFQITFQIPRDSYYTTTPSTYPRIDVYLTDDIEDQWKLAVGLSNPLKLIDKSGVRFRFHKEVNIDLRRDICGTTSGSAQRADQIASETNRTKLFPCILMAVIKHCQCHPLYSEFLEIDPSKMRDLSKQINTSDVCTLDSYDNCARAFVQFALQSMQNEPLPSSDSRISNDIAACRSYNHIACTEVKYSGNIDDYILPQEFQTTTDFFTKLTIAYETMLISERLKKIDLNIYELISSIGYNLAFWFSCGHIIWSLFRMCHDFYSIKSTDETKKRNSVLPLLVQPENRTNSDATQRRRLDVEPVIAEPVVATSPRVTSANNDHAIPHK